MPPTTASKKSISNEQWEAKLASVKVAKEDMNKLVMNFLVTEVNQCLSSEQQQLAELHKTEVQGHCGAAAAGCVPVMLLVACP
jgi:hypothetical protein